MTSDHDRGIACDAEIFGGDTSRPIGGCECIACYDARWEAHRAEQAKAKGN